MIENITTAKLIAKEKQAIVLRELILPFINFEQFVLLFLNWLSQHFN